jgi:hypothetical protein
MDTQIDSENAVQKERKKEREKIPPHLQREFDAVVQKVKHVLRQELVCIELGSQSRRNQCRNTLHKSE